MIPHFMDTHFFVAVKRQHFGIYSNDVFFADRAAFLEGAKSMFILSTKTNSRPV